MTITRSFLGFVTLLVFQQCVTTQVTLENPQLRADIRDDLMFVKLQINDKNGIFLVDTGAGISLIDLNQSEKYNFKLYENYNKGEIKGIGGKSSFVPTNGVKVVHDGTDYSGFRFYASDLEKLNEYFDAYGFNILGVVGSDFFNKTGAIIDFKSRTISFNRPQRVVKNYQLP